MVLAASWDRVAKTTARLSQGVPANQGFKSNMEIVEDNDGQ